MAAMVSTIKCMQINNYIPILYICAIYVWQKQFNLFVIQSQNTQFSFYFVSQGVIQNERLHRLITLMLEGAPSSELVSFAVKGN